jgi:hypothetical protein
MTRDRTPGERPELPAPMRAELIDLLREDVTRLAELCPEIDLALWPNFSDLA